MAKVSFTVSQLPSACSDRLLSNAETLTGKVLSLDRIPYLNEWIEFHGIVYKVVKVMHTPMASLQDAHLEVEYCEYENADSVIGNA